MISWTSVSISCRTSLKYSSSDQLAVPLAAKAALLQLVLEGDHGIGLAELLLVLGRTVLVRVDDGVALEPVAQGLDESRFRVSARLLDDLARLQHHLAQVHPVDLDRLHVVGARLLVDVGDRRGRLDRRPHAVPVVHAEPDDRELEDLREVQRLVERADVRRAVAEHAEDDILLFAVPHGPSAADGQGQVAADDSVSAHEAKLGVEHVHRAATAVRGSRFLAEELGHHGLRVDAAGDGVPVLAVAREDVVVQLERANAADDSRFLTDVEVAVAADLRLGVLLLRALFEPSDELHLAVQAEQEIAILLLQLQRLGCERGGGWGTRGFDRGAHVRLSILSVSSLSSHLPLNGEVPGLGGGWGGRAGSALVGNVNR